MSVIPTQPKIVGEKTQDYKVMYADGAYTWYGDAGGVITFFFDTFEPEINKDGSLGVKTVKRVFPIEIRMSRETYKSVINWMSERVKIIEDANNADKAPTKK